MTPTLSHGDWEVMLASEAQRTAAMHQIELQTGLLPAGNVFVATKDTQLLAATYGKAESTILSTCAPPIPFVEANAECLSALMTLAVKYVSDATKLTTLLAKQLTPIQATAIHMAGFRPAGKVAFYLCQKNRFPQTTKPPFALHPATDAEQLADIIRATCEGTLDLPVLSTAWNSQDMLEHLSNLPSTSQARWYLVADGAESVGVLLLDIAKPAAKLIYLGLAPSHRGRGWGRALVQEAMRIADAHGAEQMLLSVDCNNRPAVEIYEQVGFLKYLEQDLYFTTG